MASVATKNSAYKFIDIGANLVDPMFDGKYRGKKVHESDRDLMMQRAWDIGLERIMITSGRLSEVEDALKLCETDERLVTTVGVHPTRCNEFKNNKYHLNADQYIDRLVELAKANPDRVVAVGELGLDYDRLRFCPKSTQLTYFEKQFELASRTSLPLFLHSRAAKDDFLKLLVKHKDSFSCGVVHSFTGSLEELKELIKAFPEKLYFGINGCSLKTPENLEVAKAVPLDRLMIETDAPWCGIRPSHASFKFVKTTFPAKRIPKQFERGKTIKSRCEPVHIIQVLEVLAALHQIDPIKLAEQVYQTTKKVFFPNLSS